MAGRRELPRQTASVAHTASSKSFPNFGRFCSVRRDDGTSGCLARVSGASIIVRPGGCVTPEPSRLYWAIDPGDPRTGTTIHGVLYRWGGESPRGQVLQRVRGGPGGHVRLVRPGQPVPQPFLRW